MKKFIVIGLFMINLTQIYAQHKSDSITFKKCSGYSFHGVDKLTYFQLWEITKSNAKARKEIVVAYNNNNAGNIIFIAGVSGMVIGTLIYSIESRKPKESTLFINYGVDLVVVSISIQLFHVSKKHAKNAINIYNNDLNKSGINNVEFKFGLSSNGFGINMKF